MYAFYCSVVGLLSVNNLLCLKMYDYDTYSITKSSVHSFFGTYLHGVSWHLPTHEAQRPNVNWLSKEQLKTLERD